MRCKHCNKRSTPRMKRPRAARRSPVGTCEQCGAPIVPFPDLGLGGGDGTLAQLARFGLAITGDPLLEFKREGI
jgi:hypothetical protein